MSEKKLNLYEGMYVLAPNIGEEAKTLILKRIKSEIEQKGGQIVKVHEMGKKRLAYEIKKQKEGFYYLIYFEASPEIIKELWKDYHLIEELLRYMTLRADEVQEKIEFKSLVEKEV